MHESTTINIRIQFLNENSQSTYQICQAQLDPLEYGSVLVAFEFSLCHILSSCTKRSDAMMLTRIAT